MGYFNPVESYGQKKLSLPRIGIGIGGFTGFTDIKSQDYKPGLQYKFAYHIYLEEPIAKPLSLGLHFITGKIYGSQTVQGYDINFQSTLFSQSLRLNYNFFPLIKTKSKNFLYPYIGLGVGFISWRSKGDYKDQSGKYYADYDTTQPYSKDHLFETDLRQANLDRFGKYPQISFEVPIFLGLDIRIRKGLTARINAEYHQTFSDMLDNISSKGLGARQGKKGYDNLLAISGGINYNLAYAEDEDSKPQDLDLDGIVDSKDKCDNTPAGVRVDKKGCPVDDNNNGTPDYLEEGSQANQDFKNNIDPSKPEPVAVNSSATKNDQNSEKESAKEVEVNSEKTTTNSEKVTNNEPSANNQINSGNQTRSVVAQEESDAPAGSGNANNSGTSEVGNNRGTLAATLEEDGKPDIKITAPTANLTSNSELSDGKNNSGNKENGKTAKEKRNSKNSGNKSETESTPVGSSEVANGPSNSGKVENQSQTASDVNSISINSMESNSNSNALNEKSQSNTNSGGGDEVEVPAEKPGTNPIPDAGQSGSELAKTDGGSNKSNEKVTTSISNSPTNSASKESKSTSKESKSTSKSNSTENSNTTSSAQSNQEGNRPSEKSNQNQEISISQQPKSESSIGNELDSKSNSVAAETSSNPEVKVVNMDADEDFKSNPSTQTKSGINLKDAQTAKAEFAKAAEGKSNPELDAPSSVDLSSRLGRFAFADINKNGKISISEVNHFIDQFFDNGEEMNIKVSDIRDLIDFYFEQ